MKLKLLGSKTLPNFPSGSGLEFYDNKLYLVGDDAKDILVMDKRWNELDRINLFHSEEERIPKKIKSDLEATTIVEIKKKPYLLVLGSGSRDLRNKGLLINLQTYVFEEHNLEVFYSRLRATGIDDLNIEAAAHIEDHFVFGNRGNRSNPLNHIIIASDDFWENQQDCEIFVFKFDIPEEVKGFTSISGFTYSFKNDLLIFTTSSEDTENSYADGGISDSYIGIIENASRKIGRKKLKVNTIQNLAEVDDRFKGFKIESVCIQSDKTNRARLHLVADNDTGESHLFKLRMRY